MANTKASSPLSSTIEEAKLLASLSSSAVADIPASSHPETAAGDNGVAPKKTAVPSAYVDHSYTDYATVDEDDLRLMKARPDGGATKTATEALLGMSCSYGPMKSKGHGGSVAMPFPGKLLEVLDRGDLTAIVDWMPHGRAFIVKEPRVFEAQVLPRFFRQTKFLSFTRQLNLWGFKRITRGLDAGAYYHELFLPGRPNLAMRMRRQKIKGTGIRPMPDPDREPNFYHGYPRVARAPGSGRPGPLPPLPGEGIAGPAPGRPVPDMASFLPLPRQQQQRPPPVGSRGFLPPPSPAGGLGQHAMDGASSFGLGGLPGRGWPDTASSAAAAELRLQGTVNSRLPTTNSLSSMFGFVSSVNSNGRGGCPEDNAALPKLIPAAPGNVPGDGGGLDPKSLYLRHRAAGLSAAPRSFHPTRNDDRESHDEVASANRRLMERLMDQTMDAPLEVSERSFMSARRPYRDDPMTRPRPRGSFAQLTARRGGLLPPRKSVDVRSLPGPCFPPPRALSKTPLPTQSSAARDIEAMANAIRESRRLDELARERRAAAHALAEALQRRAGYDVRGLLSGHPFHDEASVDGRR